MIILSYRSHRSMSEISTFSEEYNQLNKTSIELKSQLEKLRRDYETYGKNDSEIEVVEKKYWEIRKQMELEESKVRIEHWKTYRGAITKLNLTNDQTEQFLKDYRANFKGEKTDEDEKLVEILDGELSEMSKYILDRIKEDFEDVEENIEYFQELREKIVNFL